MLPPMDPSSLTPTLASTIGYDQARQHVAPLHAADSGTPQAQNGNSPIGPTSAEAPAQAVAATQGGGAQQGLSNGGAGSSDSGGGNQQNDAQASHLLNSAWSTLNILKNQAAAAVSSGDAALARQLATQAAGLAGSIRVIVDSFSGAATAGSQIVLDEAASIDTAASGTGGGGNAGGTASAGSPQAAAQNAADPITLARNGLGAARQIVDAALSLPQASATDWTSLTQQQTGVMQAMQQVETAAAAMADASSVPGTAASAHGLDIKA
ncbi:hypothetical protein GALL_268190 [mine drainage metagenome]|uniref:Uncharacterized protein n=1 Tax=mine drainage metagenome TaxID=410659 RepID=A0A1J5RT88_9ZZZZ